MSAQAPTTDLNEDEKCLHYTIGNVLGTAKTERQ